MTTCKNLNPNLRAGRSSRTKINLTGRQDQTGQTKRQRKTDPNPQIYTQYDKDRQASRGGDNEETTGEHNQTIQTRETQGHRAGDVNLHKNNCKFKLKTGTSIQKS